MKDEFPLMPLVFGLLTIIGCTVIGYTIGGDASDIIGFGVGLVLGIVVFGVLSNLPNQSYLDESSWRFDEPHAAMRGPRRWLEQLLHKLGMRH
jgi:hypothetical protein